MLLIISCLCQYRVSIRVCMCMCVCFYVCVYVFYRKPPVLLPNKSFVRSKVRYSSVVILWLYVYVVRRATANTVWARNLKFGHRTLLGQKKKSCMFPVTRPTLILPPDPRLFFSCCWKKPGFFSCCRKKRIFCLFVVPSQAKAKEKKLNVSGNPTDPNFTPRP